MVHVPLSSDLRSHSSGLFFFGFGCFVLFLHTTASPLVLPAMLEHTVPLVTPWLIVSNVDDGRVPGRDELSHKCSSLQGLMYTCSQL